MTQTSPPYSQRHAHLALALQNSGLDALILNPGPSLVYLTGLHFHLSERPVVAIFTPHEPVLLILPELEMQKTSALPYPLQAFPYGEDPNTWLSVFRQAARAARLDGRQVGMEPLHLRLIEFQLLSEAAPQAAFQPAQESIATLRMHKDKDEILAMRKAADIAQNALRNTLPMVHPGVTEREIAIELTLQILHAGSDPQLPFAPIVSVGPNAANPHATPTDRPLANGDLLVIDWGAAHQGYFSDITRTFAIGAVDPEMEKIARIVMEANAAGRTAARPDLPAEKVDRAARDVIEQSGYGQYFTHRTGHGLGMESHEEPYIRAGNTTPLAVGMTFTVEPGIYLPGRNGVRIEDDIVITEDGAESLSDLPRELQQLT